MPNKGLEGTPYELHKGGNGPVVSGEIENETERLLGLHGESAPSGEEIERAHTSPEEGRGMAEGREADSTEHGDEELRLYSEWLEAWESYAELREPIAENVAELEKANLGREYGEHARALKDLTLAQERVERLDALCAGNELSVQDLADDEELASAFEAFYEDYRERWSGEMLRETVRAEEEARGLDRALQIDDLSNVPAGEEALALLTKRYGTEAMRAWPLQGIAKMRFVPEPFNDIEPRVEQKASAGASTTGFEIVIRGETNMSAEEIARQVSRELAERNSWDTAPTLTVIQRVQFLREVTELKKAPVHTPEELDPLPEGMDEGTPEHRAFEVKQYWKTLNEHYDEDPTSLNQAERDCVVKWRKHILLTKEGVEEEEAPEEVETETPSA